MSDTAQSVPPALPLAINLQYTRDLSFEVPVGAEIFATLRAQPQISVNIDVQTNRLQSDQMVYEVILSIKPKPRKPRKRKTAPPGARCS